MRMWEDSKKDSLHIPWETSEEKEKRRRRRREERNGEGEKR